MKLTIEGIKDRAAWEKAGIALPGYDVEKISEKAKEEPGWVHFGIGNIFRIFIGGIADGLLEEGVLDRGKYYLFQNEPIPVLLLLFQISSPHHIPEVQILPSPMPHGL